MSLAEHWKGLPELLILGPNHHLGKWLGTAQTLGGDVATESMHQELREIVWVKNPSRVASRRMDLARA